MQPSALQLMQAFSQQQVHTVMQPSALKQMQAISQQQREQSRPEFGYSLADSCLSMTDLPQQPVQQLLLTSQRNAVPDKDFAAEHDMAAAAAAVNPQQVHCLQTDLTL